MNFEKGIKLLNNKRKADFFICLFIILTSTIILASCSPTKGSIVILENTSGTGCSMDFKEWTSNNNWEIYLNQGEQLKIEIEHLNGNVDLNIYGKNGSEVYTGRDLGSFMFTVTVSESDDYIIEVVGVEATGRLSINKIQ